MLRRARARLQQRSNGFGRNLFTDPSNRRRGTLQANHVHPNNDRIHSSNAYVRTEFMQRASRLKNRFRGKSQFHLARQEAQRFLDAEVPKNNINTWMEQGGNAIALSQVLGFFDVAPDTALAALLLNKLVRQAEDTNAQPLQRLQAVLSLLRMRPEENYERAFTTVENLLRDLFTSMVSSSAAPPNAWAIVEVSAKVLQKCGRRVPASVTDRLSQTVKTLLKNTTQEELSRLQQPLLRIYSWIVRAEATGCSEVLDILVERTGLLRSYDFATLFVSCSLQHQYDPLPMVLIQRLLRTCLQYSTVGGGRDFADILSASARILTSLDASKYTMEEIDSMYNLVSAVLEDYQPRVRSFMNPKKPLYLDSSADVTAMVFAYELGGVLRFKSIFSSYAAYVKREMKRLDAPQVAMATGMLRRSRQLTPEIASALSVQAESFLGEMRLAELAHVCATFSKVGDAPTWLEEAHVLIQRQMKPEASPYTRSMISVAFADENVLTAADYEKLSVRQLLDLLSFGIPRIEEPVVRTLVTQLQGPKALLSPDEVYALLHCNRPPLVQSINSYLARRFAQPNWNIDTLQYLLLTPNMGRDAQKAVTAAKAASVAPEQFVFLTALLTQVFGEQVEEINAFVRAGGKDLLKQEHVVPPTLVRYLTIVRPWAKLRPDEHWLQGFIETSLGKNSMLRLDPLQMEELLISLHTIYGDVGRTPALHTLLSEVLEEGKYEAIEEPDEQAARLTVLLHHLQRGMPNPLLHAESPLVKAVRARASTYSADVQSALQQMPVPEPIKSVTVGRFTLRSRTRPSEDEVEERPPLDLNEDDPFETPEEAVPPAAAQTVAPHLSTGLEEAPAAAPVAEPTAPVEEAPLPPPPPPPPQEPEPEPAPAPAKSGGSYYAKLFGNLIGKHSEPEPEVQHYQQQQAPPEPAVLQPRRTAIPVHTAAAPTTPEPSHQPPHAPQEPLQPPVSSSNFMSSEPQLSYRTSFNALFQTTSGAPPVVEAPPAPTAPATPAQSPAAGQQPTFVAAKVGGPTPRKAVMSRIHGSRVSKPVGGVAAAEDPSAPPSAPVEAPPPPPPQTPPAPAAAPVRMSMSVRPPAPALEKEPPGIESTPGAWQETARRLGHVSRHSKSKAKTRGQEALSVWLNTPDGGQHSIAKWLDNKEKPSRKTGRRGRAAAKKEEKEKEKEAKKGHEKKGGKRAPKAKESRSHHKKKAPKKADEKKAKTTAKAAVKAAAKARKPAPKKKAEKATAPAAAATPRKRAAAAAAAPKVKPARKPAAKKAAHPKRAKPAKPAAAKGKGKKK